MLFLTDFADPGLVLPLAGLVALSLAAVGRRRQALAWSLAVAGTLAAMLVLKVSLFALSVPAAGGGLGNPSRHTAAGVIVYAGLLTLVAERFAPRLPVALLSGMAFGALFGLTRLEVGGHTLPEVLVGGAAGLAGVLALAKLAGPPRRPDARGSGHAVVAATALLAVRAFHGNRLPADAELRRVVAEFRSAGEL